ncbi:MAG: DUF3473 domain-containing protein [Candidatus Desulfofervidus auxilii]|nr:DUF3473 domain-containing protein [Candidatus Desulfofervidus auxilii]
MNLINALTIDLEDYFQVEAFASRINYNDWDNYPCHIEKNTKKILDILDFYQIKATFFCLGWIAKRYPLLIKTIAQKGHEIASHGYAHKPIYKQSPKEFREDIKRTKNILEDIIGKPVFGYRAPTYSITQKTLWALEILAEEGYKYDSSIFPIKHDLYGIPNAPRFPFVVMFQRVNVQTCQRLFEFPLTTLRILNLNIPIAGGGYFRLFPYVFIKNALKYINIKEKKPFIFYFHPWELDPNQPRINHIPWRSRFRHYVNLHKTEKKLKKLLLDFKFNTVLKILNNKIRFYES